MYRRKLVESAIQVNGDKVYTGKRHADAIKKIFFDLKELPEDRIEGFVDNEGTFYSRKDAKEVAIAAGQISPEANFYRLLSDHLW